MADNTATLSDSQIDELLNQAETRLLAKQKAQQDGNESNAILKTSTPDVALTKHTTTSTALSKAPATSETNLNNNYERPVSHAYTQHR